MRERLLIESIKTDRTLERGEDVTALAVDIRDNGMRHPILVTSDMVLIDGLRRLEALRMIGHVTVDAVTTDDFEEAVEVVAAAREDVRWTPRRVWEICKYIHPMAMARTKRAASRPRAEKMANSPLRVRYFWIRIDMEAERIMRVYREAEAGIPWAVRAVQKLDDGEIPFSAVRHILDVEVRIPNTIRIPGDILLAEDQERLLTNATQQLSGIAKGLAKLGFPLKVPTEQFGPILSDLKRYRAEISSILRKLERNQLSND